MQKRRGVVSHGTARDLADNGVGYSASGESQFSRDIAASKNVGGTNNAVVFGGKTYRERLYAKDNAEAKYNRQQEIMKVQSELEGLRRLMKTEKSPTRLSRFKKHFDDRQAYLVHLGRKGR